MVLHTWAVGLNVTPTVMGTTVNHYVSRKKRKGKPTAHLSYDVAFNLIRKFLNYASKHTVEDIQGFTGQWVPTPTWIHTDQIKIPTETIDKAAVTLAEQLGPDGIKLIGGKTWWKWRHDGHDLKAEWIEMKSDRKRRLKNNEESKRVMLYVHGGAYFFGSVDEHRYQMQRHARKLKARVLAPRYRLAPQFPFPCGLLDCLAVYMHLLTVQDPSTIILAGDSAGGGMIVSMLVTLRDRGLPLPAGAILISPWVDLTHSFPSVSADNEFDYIPPHGFMQKPSMSWPPPNSDDLKSLMAAKPQSKAGNKSKAGTEEKDIQDHNTQGVVVTDNGPGSARGSTISLPSDDLSLMINGQTIQIRDQIQMYATNAQLSHPLVSPILQPSLGGLPPLLVLVGGGEMLRDEQIYLAHKAANPTRYPPGEAYLEKTPGAREAVSKHKPTLVQLQVWDDLCHVAPTLSFTRPAKYMYRSIAQFGAWALAQAQRTDIEIIDDDAVSVISSATSSEGEGEDRQSRKEKQEAGSADIPTERIGKAGDDIPHFRNHMVRQRVDRHGNVYRLAAEQHLPALQVSSDMVGVVKPGPVQKWMKAKTEWDTKFGRQKRNVQKQRLKEMHKGFLEYKEDGLIERPPPSALAGRRGLPGTEAPKFRKSLGLAFWSMMGSSHDKDALDREEKLDRDVEATTVTVTQDGVASMAGGKAVEKSRSGSHRRTVAYSGDVNENTTVADLEAKRMSGQSPSQIEDVATGTLAGASLVGASTNRKAANVDTKAANESGHDPNLLSPKFVPMSKFKETFLPSSMPQVNEVDASKDPHVLQGTNVTLASAEDRRPKADGVAFPFKLSKGLGELNKNASTTTLTSTMELRPETPGLPATPTSPAPPATPGYDGNRALAPSGLSREVPSPETPKPTPEQADLDLTRKQNKVPTTFVAGAAGALGGAAIAGTATEVPGVLNRAETSSTIDSFVTVDSDLITPPIIAESTIFSSGPTLFPMRTTSSSSAAQIETPGLEKQLEDLGIDGQKGGPGDATPKGGAGSAGWATPRAGSVSTRGPSESGDANEEISRFETAEA